MASSMKTTTHHLRLRAVLLAVVLLLASAPAATRAAGSCESEKFPAGRSYATCADLPTLGATLHWTYDAATSTLSVAFVAKPAASAGWVSWAINPTGDGMKGAQALVAFKGGASSSAYAVNTYDIKGYAPLPAASTPIAFNATGLAADESAGKIRLYGKLQLPQGMTVVNHIWQVGSTVAGGAPIKHAFAEENLNSKGKLVLTGHGAQVPASAPTAEGPSAEPEDDVAVPASSPSGGKTAAASSPSGGKSAAATTYAPAAPAVLIVLALSSFLAFV